MQGVTGDGKVAAMVASGPEGLTVLVVEDEILIRDSVVTSLEDAGLHVIAVASGEEALVLLRRDNEVDLVFTDINLAGKVDGWEVGLECKERLPVLYTSGVANPRPQLKDHFIAKPYDVQAVVNACQILLQ